MDETRYAYSGSREVAEFLHARHLDRDAVLVAPGRFWNSPLVYLPGTRVWSPPAERFGTYIRLERSEYLLGQMPVETAVAKAEQQLRGRRWVLILNSPLPKSLETRYRLRFRTTKVVWRAKDELYWVYAADRRNNTENAAVSVGPGLTKSKIHA